MSLKSAATKVSMSFFSELIFKICMKVTGCYRVALRTEGNTKIICDELAKFLLFCLLGKALEVSEAAPAEA